MSWLGRLLVLLTALVVFLFAIIAVNQTDVSLTFLAWQTPEVSVFWWLLIAFSIGLGLGVLWLTVISARARLRERGLSRRLEASNRELRELRNQSLIDG